ncbi:FAD-dependent monooxygenase [Streptomyces sp. CA-251247]|uniref:FAD-dependent monooxygenase n=1 Tax=Streptomyces sp. CA-251247 TaxID=3240062 RepID=UPI003D92B630
MQGWIPAAPAAEAAPRIWARPCSNTPCSTGTHRAERPGPWPKACVGSRESVERGSHGRTTLIEDAAHAMHPIGSHGATRSVVDGRALAHVLALHPDPVATVSLGSPYGPTVRARR